MKMQYVPSAAALACTRLEIIRNECDAVSVELQVAARSTEWESDAARSFSGHVWDRIGEVASAGDLAMQVLYSVRSQLDAKGP